MISVLKSFLVVDSFFLYIIICNMKIYFLLTVSKKCVLKMGINNLKNIDIIIQKRYYMFISSVYANRIKNHVAKMIHKKGENIYG